MKPFRWSAAKNELLKAERGVSFETMVVAIGAGGLLDVLAHPNPTKYPGQRVLVVVADDYVYLVPGRAGEPFEVLSYGADGEPGGTGEDADISTSRRQP